MISTYQYEVNELHLGENARGWIGSIIVLMVRLQPSTRSLSSLHMEGPMWIQTRRRLNWVKISALRCGDATAYLRHVFVRPNTHDSWVLAKNGRVLWLWSRCWSLNFMQHLNTYCTVAVSGYSFKIQTRPRFERFERLKKIINIIS